MIKLVLRSVLTSEVIYLPDFTHEYFELNEVVEVRNNEFFIATYMEVK